MPIHASVRWRRFSTTSVRAPGSYHPHHRIRVLVRMAWTSAMATTRSPRCAVGRTIAPPRMRSFCSRLGGLLRRRRSARPPWGRRGDRSRGMRSCRRPAPPAARGYRVGRGCWFAGRIQRRQSCVDVHAASPKRQPRPTRRRRQSHSCEMTSDSTRHDGGLRRVGGSHQSHTAGSGTQRAIARYRPEDRRLCW